MKKSIREIARRTRGRGTAKTVAFDVDSSGYLKNTAWLNNNDGFLFLDRNLNGQIDSGRELFSNAAVELGLRVSGFTHGTGYLDANGIIHYKPDANYYGAANDGEWVVGRRVA